MSWRLAKSLDVLRAQINAAYPDRSKISDGTIGDVAHSARTSDHNPNAAGVVCAMDVTHDPAHLDGETLATCLVENRDERIKYVIWNKRMCRSYPANGKPAWTWQPYSGINAHQHHVHISVKPEKALYDSGEAWALPDEKTLPEDEPEPAKPPVETTSSETATVVKEEHSSSIISNLTGNAEIKQIASEGASKLATKAIASLTTASTGTAAAGQATGVSWWFVLSVVLAMCAVGIVVYLLFWKSKKQIETARINSDPARHDIHFT